MNDKTAAADDPGPVPTELPLLQLDVPALFEHKIQISEGRYIKVRGFADKPRCDLVLITGTHEQVLTTLNVCDAVNVSWLLDHVCRQLGAAHEKWRAAHYVPAEG